MAAHTPGPGGPGRDPRHAEDKRARFARVAIRAALAVALASLSIAGTAVAADGTGGVVPGPVPTLSAVSCIRDCAGRNPQPGATIRLRGRHLRATSAVVFIGAAGAGDDVEARPKRRTERLVEVRVPKAARTGPVRVLSRDGAASEEDDAMVRIGQVALTELPRSGGVVDAKVLRARVFFGGRGRATLTYAVRSPGALPVRIDLVRLSDEVTVARWAPGAVAPNAAQSVTWTGRQQSAAAPVGRYEFRVYAGANASAPAPPLGTPSATPPPAPDGGDIFDFFDHRFPVDGPHDYGGAAGRFGAGRDAHTHEGQDVMAKCGTPLLAARGGVVQRNAVQSLAGNYLIIDGDGTDVDYGYMHLRRRSPLKAGARVFTGQRIGFVGDTGDATACHLHFEMWSGPGWYEGGEPMDPLPSLEAWDANS